jgi:GNAT superfamily N-acetyltransferase
MRTVDVTRTYLELTAPDRLAAAVLDDPRARVDNVRHCPAAFYRFLYAEVGRNYHWRDRLSWTDDDIRAHLARREISLWVLYYDGAPAGFFELKRGDDGSTEIAYFGLLQDFLGRGLGRYLLTVAVQRAWTDGARRVWLHTCTLDDPAALPNYRARGFEQVRTEVYETEIPGD